MPSMENAYALVVGIANYQKIRPLPETVLKDAQDIQTLLIHPHYCGYAPENVQLLLDGQATQAALHQALDRLAQGTKADSTVFIYISSHGGRVDFGPHQGEYLLPVDADSTSGASLTATAIPSTQFTEALRAIPARKLVVVFDCCHSGGIGQPKDDAAPVLKAGFSDNAYEALKQGKGRAILASSRSEEFSYVAQGATNSVFTQHFLAGLKGGIASDDGLIRLFNVFEYLQPRVTGAFPDQHPIFKAELEENFPVALYLGGQKGAVPQVEEGFRYDAYISYVDQAPDTGWVWDILVPKLEDAGLKIAVSGDSEKPGVARVVNIERGIQQSKRTVVMLSETYLADHMAAFENTLGQTMGIQEGTYRLLPIKSTPLDTSRLPTRLSMLTTLDLTHPRRAEREFSRLIEALRQPLPRM
ncbi:caspase family protein [Stenomitos frigidus]